MRHCGFSTSMPEASKGALTQEKNDWTIWTSDMEILIDTNIVLDWLLGREPFLGNAKRIMEPCICGKIKGYLASHTLLNTFYITRKEKSVEERKEILLMLCEKFTIIGLDRQTIIKSLHNKNLKVQKCSSFCRRCFWKCGKGNSAAGWRFQR